MAPCQHHISTYHVCGCTITTIKHVATCYYTRNSQVRYATEGKIRLCTAVSNTADYPRGKCSSCEGGEDKETQLSELNQYMDFGENYSLERIEHRRQQANQHMVTNFYQQDQGDLERAETERREQRRLEVSGNYQEQLTRFEQELLNEPLLSEHRQSDYFDQRRQILERISEDERRQARIDSEALESQQEPESLERLERQAAEILQRIQEEQQANIAEADRQEEERMRSIILSWEADPERREVIAERRREWEQEFNEVKQVEQADGVLPQNQIHFFDPQDTANSSLLKVVKTDSCCDICYHEMNTTARQLPCHHIFHRNCILSWFETQEKSTCPACRQQYRVMRIPDFNEYYC